MKRLPICLFVFFILVALTGHTVDIYVAPKGSDTNPGTKEKPLATITTALRKARELRRLNDPSVANAIHIILLGGTYQLYEPIFIRPGDAGTPASPTFIKAAPNEQPVLSGGVNIKEWKKLATPVTGLPARAKGKIWVTDMPLVGGRLFEIRQLWINGKKAVRAKDMNGEAMNRIISWDKNEETCWIPAPESPVKNVEGLEMD
jgi:hypothetical protein